MLISPLLPLDDSQTALEQDAQPLNSFSCTQKPTPILSYVNAGWFCRAKCGLLRLYAGLASDLLMYFVESFVVRFQMKQFSIVVSQEITARFKLMSTPEQKCIGLPE
jgi:hypothetical protein